MTKNFFKQYNKEIIERYIENKQSIEDLSLIYDTSCIKLKEELTNRGLYISKKHRKYDWTPENEHVRLEIIRLKKEDNLKYYQISKKLNMRESVVIKVLQAENLMKTERSNYNFDNPYDFLKIDKTKENTEFIKFLSDRSKKLFRQLETENIANTEYKKFITKNFFDSELRKMFEQSKEKNNILYDLQLDHIFPKSLGGENMDDNLEFLNACENRAKGNLTKEQWDFFRRQTDFTCDLFSDIKYKNNNQTNKTIAYVPIKQIKEEILAEYNFKKNDRYKAEKEFYEQFEDYRKVKFLKRLLPKNAKKELPKEQYKAYLLKFYYDKQFNLLFDEWIKTGNILLRPSFDHIQPLSKKGSTSLENIQIISWIENCMKNSSTQEQWEKFKQDTNMKADFLF